PGMADEDADPIGQPIGDLGLDSPAVRGEGGLDDVDTGGREPLPDLGRRVKIRLGDDEQRIDVRVEGGHECAIDEAVRGFGVDGGGDDAVNVDVGDEDALGRVGVIGAASQQAASLRDLDQTGQGPVTTGGVADELDDVSGHDG